jgi:2-keto-4-pentenoate hydratase/2-oxohepta-3-ene-1,7-dioic acid hydratase in catechol pathway
MFRNIFAGGPRLNELTGGTQSTTSSGAKAMPSRIHSTFVFKQVLRIGREALAGQLHSRSRPSIETFLRTARIRPGNAGHEWSLRPELLVVTSKAESQKFVRFEAAGRVAYGRMAGGEIEELAGSIFNGINPTGVMVRREEVRLLVPCEPTKVVAVGLNYASHQVFVKAAEGGFTTPGGKPLDMTKPVIFAKFPSSLIPDGADIVFPEGATNVHFEGELALVVGRKATRVSEAAAKDHVFGVSICNDLVDREWLLNDLQWFRAKGSDGFGPMGPAIVTGLDYSNLRLRTWVNGDLRQDSSTRDLVYSPDKLLSYVSQWITLLPGDVIFTGTPGQTQAVSRGDRIEIEIEGIGRLSNSVAA